VFITAASVLFVQLRRKPDPPALYLQIAGKPILICVIVLPGSEEGQSFETMQKHEQKSQPILFSTTYPAF